MTNLENMSDTELETIVSSAQNTHVDGSLYNRAKNTLEVRRSRRLFEQQEEAAQIQAKASRLQEEFFEAAKERLDKIIKLLDKPGWAIFWAGVGAVAVGVIINFATDLYRLLPIFKVLH